MQQDKKEQRIIEVRAAQQPPDSTDMIVEGRAIVFNSPTLMYVYDGLKYYETIDAGALDACDMSDVVLRYNHSDDIMIMARTRKGSLSLIKDDIGLSIKGKLFDIQPARDLYTLIRSEAISQMSFSFIVSEDSYNQDTRTRTILKVKKIYDVSACDFGAYGDNTNISARSFFELQAEAEKLVKEQEARKRLLLLTYL